jgi:hypothetical protein
VPNLEKMGNLFRHYGFCMNICAVMFWFCGAFSRDSGENVDTSSNIRSRGGVRRNRSNFGVSPYDEHSSHD